MNQNTRKQKSLVTAAELAQVTHGILVQGDPASSCVRVGTDSREQLSDSLFIALFGENFDGARFCDSAVKGGAKMVLVAQQSWKEGVAGKLPDRVAVVTVKDTLIALGDLAAWHRRKFPARVIGITGSNGKTTTKELTAAVLGGTPGVLFNRGNLNNLVGMPRSLLLLEEGHHHAVMEMGMNVPGEIQRLAEIAYPQIGLITNVHPVHLEGLGTIEAVARSKGELFAALSQEATAVVNADDIRVMEQINRTRAQRVTFGQAHTADVRVVSAQQTAAGLQVHLAMIGRSVQFCIRRAGLHNAMNAAAAACVGLVEGIALDLMVERLEQAPLPSLRMERLDLGDGHLLVDCYNANPRSVQSGLTTLAELAPVGKRFAILGDMRELGRSSIELHQETGRFAASMRLSGLCSYGELAKNIAVGAREGGLTEVDEASTLEEAIRWVNDRMQHDNWVLLKGSRAMRMERIAMELTQRFGVLWKREEKE